MSRIKENLYGKRQNIRWVPSCLPFANKVQSVNHILHAKHCTFHLDNNLKKKQKTSECFFTDKIVVILHVSHIKQGSKKKKMTLLSTLHKPRMIQCLGDCHSPWWISSKELMKQVPAVYGEKKILFTLWNILSDVQRLLDILGTSVY